MSEDRRCVVYLISWTVGDCSSWPGSQNIIGPRSSSSQVSRYRLGLFYLSI